MQEQNDKAKVIEMIPEANLTQYPDGEFSPLKYSRLPASYNIHATQEQYTKMTILGRDLREKHPSWSEEKLFRKVFEKFPSVKISLKKIIHGHV